MLGKHFLDMVTKHFTFFLTAKLFFSWHKNFFVQKEKFLSARKKNLAAGKIMFRQ